MNTPDWLLYGGIGAAALWLLPRLMPRKHGENHPPAITDTSAPQLRPPAIANGRFRILDAESLIYELGLAPSVANIKSQLGLTNENWDRDGLPLLHNFITLVQRLPASESHHHAGDGGLAKHTLDVAAMALLASNAKSWPPDAKTEDIARLSTVWRYGILAAALLHDIGKVITSFEIPLYKTSDDDNFILWQPDTGRMSDSGRTFYRVVFPDHKTPYSVHKTLGWTFFQNIVPQHARGWMAASDPNLVNALRNYLGGSDEKSALAEIIRTADMQSVARDLKFGSRQRLATAKRRPLNEIVMDTLIEMLAERGAYFSIATTAGGDLFYHGGMVYMMAKNVPDRVRDFLAANEPQLAKSIPSDNQRIFDTLLEYGLVEANTFDPGKAVSNIAVTFAKSDGELKTYPFTVLKFRPETLFPNGPLPAEFAGVLKELDAPIKRQAVSDGHTDRKDDAVSADDVPSETRNTVHEAQTAGHIPEDCVIPPPPKARRLPDTEPKSIEPKSIEPKSIEPKSIEPKSIEPKSIDSIDEFLNQHNIFSEDDTDGSASEHDATSEPVPQMEQHPEKPVIAAKSVPAKKSKHAAKPITASKLGAKKLEELVTAGRDSDAAAISGSETTLPADQTETDAASRSEQDIQAVSPDADREDSDALPYEASSGAGLAEAWAELDSLPRRSPRSVTVHQPESVLNAPENPANDADGIQRLNEQRESLLADGRKFLNWLAGGLADGTISVNQSNSPVHVIDRGMLLVTPEIFRMYSLGYFDKNNPECPGVKAQKAFLALGMHERTKRTGIFSAKAEDKHLFTCFLIPEEKLHYIINTDRRPANNIDITIEESRFGKSLERKA